MIFLDPGSSISRFAPDITMYLFFRDAGCLSLGNGLVPHSRSHDCCPGSWELPSASKIVSLVNLEFEDRTRGRTSGIPSESNRAQDLIGSPDSMSPERRIEAHHTIESDTHKKRKRMRLKLGGMEFPGSTYQKEKNCR
ncbi:unnamed protein product [Darwinula stevensoni]|uniref:Uncharacterized protein n=1 Tax=Darwinula stevensoni TaxID=69355 RepID=A0A7R9A194_9CRUS|nr:unnamed protein product [Darwinula stevensoni]CAG0886174.1 unnamed protein product [Darwinula stevensoni]